MASNDDEGLVTFLKGKHTFEQHRGWKVAVSWLNPDLFSTVQYLNFFFFLTKARSYRPS